MKLKTIEKLITLMITILSLLLKAIQKKVEKDSAPAADTAALQAAQAEKPISEMDTDELVDCIAYAGKRLSKEIEKKTDEDFGLLEFC